MPKGETRANLPPIPLRRIQGTAALIEAEHARLQALVASAVHSYPDLVLRFGDRLSRRWLRKTHNPYLHEIEAVAEALGRPGAYFLNLSYEWTCTCSVGAAPAGDHNRLLRVLDWPFDGLGTHVVAVHQQGPAGAWTNLTWPGFTGTIQALAPGRFAAAFNQAPLRRRSPSMAIDWSIDRLGVWSRRALPPAHILRQVFDEARTYRDAKRRLSETPIAMPAIFSLSGLGVEECCVIERLETGVEVHEGPNVAANHWLGPMPKGRPRGDDSQGRAALMARLAPTAGDDLAWLAPPVLNPMTRLVMLAEPATGKLVAQGFESRGPATAITAIAA